MGGHRLLPLLAVFLFAASAAVRAETDTAGDQDQSWVAYLDRVAQEAIREGVSPATIETAFNSLEPDERVIGFDRRQPEFVQTFEEYLVARVTDFRQREGRRLYREHQALLQEIGAAYGVDPEYIVAFWGLETSFGRYQGKYSIIRSLATLGFDQRRSAFFTAELIKALHILDEGHVAPDQFVGAWAGAMGQGQFMPSSFLRFAVDYDGDGRKDIWSNQADVFASIANYLKQAGWKSGAGWGTRVNYDASLQPGDLKPETRDTSCRALKHHTKQLPLSDWRNLGVSWEQSPGVGDDNSLWALIVPDGDQTNSYLVGGNFRTILRYNCANKYAVSVGLLAEAITQESS